MEKPRAKKIKTFQFSKNNQRSAEDDDIEREELAQLERTKEREEIEKQNKSIIDPEELEALNNQLEKCIELGKQNKINENNVWGVTIIDIIQKLAKKNTVPAASALQTCSKVFAIRVENTHNLAVQMASEMDFNADDNNKDEEYKEDESYNDDDSKKTKKKVRKFQNKHNCIAKEEEIIEMPKLIEIPEAVYTKINENNFDFMQSKSLTQSWLDINPINLSLKSLSENDYYFEDAKKNSNHKNQIKTHIDKETVEINFDIDEGEICPELKDFSFIKCTSANDEYTIANVSVPQLENFVFHENAELESLTASFRLSQENLNVVRDEIEAANDNKTAQSYNSALTKPIQYAKPFMFGRAVFVEDYIKFNSNVLWAGPSYWKTKGINFKLTNLKQKTQSNVVSHKKKNQIELIKYDMNKEYGKEFEQSLRHTKKIVFSNNEILKWKLNKNRFPKDYHIGYEHFAKIHCINQSFDSLKVGPSNQMIDNKENLKDQQSREEEESYSPMLRPDEYNDDDPDLHDLIDIDNGALLDDNLLPSGNTVKNAYLDIKNSNPVEINKLKQFYWEAILKETKTDKNTDLITVMKTVHELNPELANKNEHPGSPLLVLLSFANEKKLEVKSVPEYDDILIKNIYNNSKK